MSWLLDYFVALVQRFFPSLAEMDSLKQGIKLTIYGLLLLVLASVVFVLLWRAGKRRHEDAEGAKKRFFRPHIFACLALPGAFLALVIEMLCSLPSLGLSSHSQRVAATVVDLLFIAALVWGLLRLVDYANDHFKFSAQNDHNPFNGLLFDLLRRFSKAIIWVIAVLFAAQNVLNFDIAALLAGAGVAGLAIAFAAQNTIANFFGAITLIMDRPFTEGDRVKIGDKEGLIETVGLRSTLIRSLSGTLIAVPNREMAESAIENVTRRPNFKHIFNLRLVYSTSPEKMDRALALLHEILDGNPMFDMANSPPRIAFSELKDWSLNVTAIVWFQTTDYFVYLAELSRINSMILRRFHEEGLEFAFPSTTNYLAGDSSRPVKVQS